MNTKTVPDRQLIEIAMGVWLERARRRPFAAAGAVVVLAALVTMLSVRLVAGAVTAAPAATALPASAVAVQAITHVVLVLAMSVGVVTLCDWLLRLETPGFSVRALRFGWGWNAFENLHRYALPHGQLAMLTACAVLAWPTPPALIAVVVNYAVWAGTLAWFGVRSRASLGRRTAVRRLLQRETQRAQMLGLFSGMLMLPAVLFRAWIIGAIVALGLVLATAVSIPVRELDGRLSSRLRSRGFEFALRALPGAALLVCDGATALFWSAVPGLKTADPQLAYGVGTIVFTTLAGLCAGRLFERHCRRGVRDSDLTAGGDMQALLTLETGWRATALRGVVVSAAGLGSTTVFLFVLAWMTTRAPAWAVIAVGIFTCAWGVISAVVALVTNILPYAALCDMPRQQEILIQIEQGLGAVAERGGY